MKWRSRYKRAFPAHGAVQRDGKDTQKKKMVEKNIRKGKLRRTESNGGEHIFKNILSK